MKVVSFAPQNKIADDTAATLRQLADRVDSGHVTALVLSCIDSGEYETMRFSSLTDSLVLSNLLTDSILKGFRG